MRILWFSLTPSCYKSAKGLGYNGGGWISSLETEFIKRPDVELGIAFLNGRRYVKEMQNGVCYYVMPIPQKTYYEKLNYFINYKVQTEIEGYLPIFKKVVDDFKPDVIQVFGSESYLGFVKQVTDVPCVLHIQGIINPYWEAFFPPGFSKATFISRNKSPKKMWCAYKELKTWENTCKREREVLKQVKEEFGSIDILVNNAGITKDGLMLRMTEAQWDAVIAVNLKSAFNFIHACVPVMMRQRGGSIINMASVVGVHGNAGQSNYAASKAGLIALAKSVGQEMGPKGIRANAIAPGFIDTAMTQALSDDIRKQWITKIPLRRGGTVEDIANCATFLASDMSSYISGQVIQVDGGMNM